MHSESVDETSDTTSSKRPRIELRFHQKEYVEAIEKLIAQNPQLTRVRVDPPEQTIVTRPPKKAVLTTKAEKYGDDKLLMHHTCIRQRRENCFELNIKNSPQFSGEKYVGRYGDMEGAISAARRILESDDHLAAIAEIYNANPRNLSNYSTQRMNKRAGRLEALGNFMQVDFSEGDGAFRLICRDERLSADERLVGVFKTEAAAISAAQRIAATEDHLSAIRKLQMKQKVKRRPSRSANPPGNSSATDGIWKYIYWGSNKQLYFRNSTQFSGRKLIGTYEDEKTVLAIIREVLESEDHIATIESLKRRNPRSKKYIEAAP